MSNNNSSNNKSHVGYVILVDQYSESDVGFLYEAYKAKDLIEVRKIIKSLVDDGYTEESISVLKIFEDLDFKVTKTINIEFL